MAIQYTSNYDETLGFSDVCWQFSLAASTAQQINIPGGASVKYSALFGIADDKQVLVRKNGVAALPGSGANTVLQYCELNPCKRYVQGGDTLSLITPDAGVVVSVSLREIPA